VRLWRESEVEREIGGDTPSRKYFITVNFLYLFIVMTFVCLTASVFVARKDESVMWVGEGFGGEGIGREFGENDQ
jgi:hypothetical protein